MRASIRLGKLEKQTETDVLHKGKSFQGSWENRLNGLFDYPIKFGGATVLDIGCNMGIIGYEVCKRRPTFYHGVEGMIIHSLVAKMIFKGVKANSRIDRFNVTKASARARKLERQYDIVMYLAVHQHLRKQVGVNPARDVAFDLFGRCQNVLIFRGPHIEEISEIAEAQSFELAATVPGGDINELSFFRRSG